MTTNEDFFQGSAYTEKVLGQMKQGDYHSFPESVRALQDAGVRLSFRGADGRCREMLAIPGEFRGVKGVFEFIKEADGMINHRLFRPMGREES
jgi:filamentous hemagglutinin